MNKSKSRLKSKSKAAGEGARPTRTGPTLWSGGSGSTGGLGGQFHQVGGDAVGQVAGHHVLLVKVVAQDRNDAHFFDGLEVSHDLVGAFQGVFGFQGRGRGGAIDEREIENAFDLGMAIQRA